MKQKDIKKSSDASSAGYGVKNGSDPNRKYMGVKGSKLDGQADVKKKNAAQYKGLK